jgi:hypothetical protein
MGMPKFHWISTHVEKALRLLGQCWQPTAAGDSESLGHHGVSAATVGVSALAQHLFHFEITSQVYWSFIGFDVE